MSRWCVLGGASRCQSARGTRPSRGLFLLAVMAVVVAGCERPQARNADATYVRLPEYPERRFPTLAWDTLLVIGSSSPDDTVLISPSSAWLWGNRVVVTEVTGEDIHIRAFSRDTGSPLWTFGRLGRGPGELTCIAGTTRTPEGLLWINDSCNGKIVELDSLGRLTRELTNLPSRPFSGITFVGGRALLTTQRSDRALIWADPQTLEPQRIMPLPWPDSLDSSYLLTFCVDTVSGGQSVVLAYYYGPAFMVLTGDSVRVHPFITPAPFAKKGFRESVPFAAKSISVIGDEIFFLFGGTSNRIGSDGKLVWGEPTVLIDVYGLDGAYHRSYRLPPGLHGRNMFTEDGRDFLVNGRTEDGGPQLLLLRPAGT